MRRNNWTDERIGEKMGAIDSTFEMLRDELTGLRSEMREELRGLREDNRDQFTASRQDFSALRAELSGLQRHLIQIGFGLVGVLLAAMLALVATVVSLG